MQLMRAFIGHADPLFGVDAGAKYDALFSRIVNLAPPPMGVGTRELTQMALTTSAPQSPLRLPIFATRTFRKRSTQVTRAGRRDAA